MNTFRFLWFYQQKRNHCWSKVIEADNFQQAIEKMTRFLDVKSRRGDVVVDHLVVTDDSWLSLTDHPFAYPIEWGMEIYPSGFFPSGKNQIAT